MICKTCGQKMVKTGDGLYLVCPSPARHGKLIPVKVIRGAWVPSLSPQSPDRPSKHAS